MLISPQRVKGKLSWYCSKRPVFVSGFSFCKCIELCCRCIEDEDSFICIEMNWWYIENVLRCIQIYCRCIDTAARIWYSRGCININGWLESRSLLAGNSFFAEVVEIIEIFFKAILSTKLDPGGLFSKIESLFPPVFHLGKAVQLIRARTGSILNFY